MFLLAVPGIILLGLLFGVGIPALTAQVANFIQNVPRYIQGVTLRVERWQLMLERRDLPYVDEDALLARLRSVRPEAVAAYLQERQSALAAAAWRGVLGVGRGVSSLLTLLSYVFLTPILVFYLLRDWDRVTGSLAGLVPPGQQERVLGFFREYDRLLAGYLRGNFLESAIVGVLTWLGYWALGVPYALLLGVIAGVFNVIPYMGLIVSVIPAIVIALFTANILLSLGKVFLVFIVVQLLDGSYIGPKIVGEAVGLHPVWIILALSMAGYFFGFVGLLLAVPLAVLVKLLLASALTRYRGSVLFRGGGRARHGRAGARGRRAGPRGGVGRGGQGPRAVRRAQSSWGGAGRRGGPETLSGGDDELQGEPGGRGAAPRARPPRLGFDGGDGRGGGGAGGAVGLRPARAGGARRRRRRPRRRGSWRPRWRAPRRRLRSRCGWGRS